MLNGITGDFGTAVIGTNFIISGLVVMAFGVLAFLVALSTGLVGLAVLSVLAFLLGALLELLGEILAVVSGGFSLSSRYNVDELKWGGLLYVVGLLLFVIISVIGLVIYYYGTGEAIRKVKTSPGDNMSHGSLIYDREQLLISEVAKSQRVSRFILREKRRFP